MRCRHQKSARQRKQRAAGYLFKGRGGAKQSSSALEQILGRKGCDVTELSELTELSDRLAFITFTPSVISRSPFVCTARKTFQNGF